MQVASTRESLILALKNDKNSERWEEFVNQYYDFLYFAACKVDKKSGCRAFTSDGVDPCEAVEQTFWQLKNIVLPDRPQYDVDFTEDELAKKVRHGLKWKIFELDKGKRFRNYLLSVLKNVSRSLYNARKSDRLVFVDNQKLERGWEQADDFEDEDSQPLWEAEHAILFFDEIDGLVQDRANARASWEIAQVNELLQQMENFDGVMVAATNFCTNLDSAIMRRFTFKLEFDYLDDAGKKLFFERMFRTRLTDAEFAELKALGNLAPGDFRTVRQEQFYLASTVTNQDRIEALREECKVKKDGHRTSRIGFAA